MKDDEIKPVQLWVEDLKDCPTVIFCPSCAGCHFSATIKEYGVELECWNCPTYIGIRKEVLWDSSRKTRRRFARLFGKRA